MVYAAAQGFRGFGVWQQACDAVWPSCSKPGLAGHPGRQAGAAKCLQERHWGAQKVLGCIGKARPLVFLSLNNF